MKYKPILLVPQSTATRYPTLFAGNPGRVETFRVKLCSAPAVHQQLQPPAGTPESPANLSRAASHQQGRSSTERRDTGPGALSPSRRATRLPTARPSAQASIKDSRRPTPTSPLPTSDPTLHTSHIIPLFI
ncbi:hypothetical protein evm_007705 [Chilo suppressalis]|nr:hypothetical protein evm_007705 [Chilo suppressalis]